MASQADDFSLVFSYVCKGKLPEDGNGKSSSSSEVAQYLAAAQQLKGLRLPPQEAPTREDEGEREREGERAIAPSDEAVGDSSRKRKLASAAGEAAVAAVGAATTEDVLGEACALVRRFRFGHEHVGDSRLLRCPELWSAMLDVGMPLTALVRNLGRLSALGVLHEPARAADVAKRLSCEAAVQSARLHPIALLEALRVYQSGRGEKGSLTWEPSAEVERALEAAFYLAFKNVEPTGLRYLLGVDVSGSMDGAKVCGMPSLCAREAAGAMLMALLRTEREVTPMAFSDDFCPLKVTRDMSLGEVSMAMDALPFQGTDCSLPMLYALEHRIPVDVFVVLTDNETYSGAEHPAAALRRYREAMGLPAARLVVMAFSVTEFSIADPEDPGMMDVAGLDSAVPRIIRDFVMGQL